MNHRLIAAVSEFVVHGASLSLVVLLLIAVGQPIFTDDLWWHLAMGGEYAVRGPWLDSDPFLFGAERAAEPAAWLTDVLFYGVHLLGGFQALRVLHVGLVIGILWLGWSILKGSSGSRIFASLGTSLFAVLSAYRFFQLRPHLFSMLAALILIRLIVIDRRPPTARRIVAAMGVMVLWANAHGAFVLGPVLLAAAVSGVVAAALLSPREDPRAWKRARRMGLALVLCLVATFLNPAGPRFLMLYFTAGTDTPDLTVVADEWTPVALFSAPVANLPPTPLVFALVWGLLFAAVILVGLYVYTWRSTGAIWRGRVRVDPALVAMGAASLVGLLSAVRLLWLSIFVLLAMGRAVRVLAPAVRGAIPFTVARLAAATAAVSLVPGFLDLGDWRMISQGVQSASYSSPYSTAKYNAHAVWFMRDTGIEGRVYNEYWIGNFLSYWLSPRLQVFVNGSLNIPKEMMQASHDIWARRTDRAGRTTSELLDLYGVDIFFGTGLPVVPPPGRPLADTTRHIEWTPGFILIFRNMQSAVYLRVSASNRENLERVIHYYAKQGVPFDSAAGFDPARVIREAPAWAVAHGLIPADFAGLEARIRSAAVRRVAQNRMASLYALLGLYDRAAAIDEQLLVTPGGHVAITRRLVWSLLHAGRVDEAAGIAGRLATLASPNDSISQRIIAAARRSAAAPKAERAAILATLPVFTRPQGRQAVAGFVVAEPRPVRR